MKTFALEEGGNMYVDNVNRVVDNENKLNSCQNSSFDKVNTAVDGENKLNSCQNSSVDEVNRAVDEVKK